MFQLSECDVGRAGHDLADDGSGEGARGDEGVDQLV
jgi:hypothetical protein